MKDQSSKQDSKPKEEEKKEVKKEENKEDSSKSTQAQSVQNDPVLMKKGDYMVHVLVEEVKNLVPKKIDFLPKPVVKILCFNQNKRTAKVSVGCLEYAFNEHMYFEATDLPVEVLDSSKIVIEVYDYNESKRQDFLGIYEFDLEYVYSSENHSIKNIWIALANPEGKDITQIRGYLKLSISVLHENDERIELNPNPSKDNECMIPPQIKVHYKQLNISIFKAEELPDMDNIMSKEKKINRECNGYVECKYMGITLKTSVVDMKNEIIKWNEVFQVPISIPAISQRLVFTVKDHNKVSKDEIIGSFEITVNDILEDKFSKLQSINIYGSSVNNTSEISKIMNSNAEIGSRWKGRVYIIISLNSCDAPITGVVPIKDEEQLKLVYNTSRSNLWSVYVKLLEAYYLPTDTGKYGIKVCIQDNEQLFPIKPAENRTIKWYLHKKLQCQTLTSNKHELPDVFIYLVNEKDERICFQRIKSSEFHLNDDIMMIKLIPDPCIGKVTKMFLSGIVKIKIKMFNKAIDKSHIDLSAFYDGENEEPIQSEDEDLEALMKKPDKPKEIQSSSTVKPFTIVANIYMSRYLIPGDSNGMSDPYAVLSIHKEKKETAVKDSSANGIWNESLVFDNIMININDKSTWPVMLLTVMDKDLTSSDMLGYTYVWLCDSSYELNNRNTLSPVWVQLFLEKSNRPQGEILISFYIFDQKHTNLVQNINILPETIPYTVEINALGLRDLKPLSFIPVKKAFVSFDLNSINVTGKKEDSILPIKTQPCDSGPNPNINSVIKFDVKLPKDEIFIPEMQCEVYDHVLGGLINQLLGIFMLPIRDLIRETNTTIDSNIKKTKEKINSALNAQMENPKFIDPSYTGSENIQPNDMIINKELNIQKDTLKVPLVKGEENKQDLIDEKSLLCNSLEDLSVIYQGPIDKEKINLNKNNPNFFVLKPSFKPYAIPGVKKDSPNFKEFLIENEEQIPPEEYYFSLGFNKNCNDIRLKTGEENIILYNDPEKNRKHYRRIYGKELEDVSELGLACPFNKSRLVRGKYYDKAEEMGIFEAIANIDSKILKRFSPMRISDKALFAVTSIGKKIENQKIIEKNLSSAFDTKPFGKFKGLIRVAEKTKMKEYQEFVNKIAESNNGVIPEEYDYLATFDTISKNILIRRSVVIRVYILELNRLAKKDVFSESDPYIKIFIGNELKVNEKENKIDDQIDCKWYKHYDILSEFPGNSTMTIEVIDYDPLFADELIGETKLDLEDRYFDQKWNSIKNPPIEIRQLYHPDYSTSQGEVKMWLEIFEKNERGGMKVWNIEPEPESTLEMRLIIWETENMECLDIEGTSDIYVIGYIDQELKQSTDIHFRCQTGQASFNWRMVIPIQIPRKKYELIFQVYDNDIFARDDFICGGKMNLYKMIRDANTLDLPIVFDKSYYDALPPNEKNPNIEFCKDDDNKDFKKFWIQMFKANEKKGRVLCSLEILPQWKAEITKVGKGRDEPNIDPYLPPPFGRIYFSWNPFKMLNQLVGPKFRRIIYCACCLALLIIYLCFVIPYIIYHLGGEISNPINWINLNKK